MKLNTQQIAALQSISASAAEMKALADTALKTPLKVSEADLARMEKATRAAAFHSRIFFKG